MATKRFQFFCTQGEICAVLSNLVDKLSLVILGFDGASNSLKEIDLMELDHITNVESIYRIYASDNKVILDAPSMRGLNLGRLGLLQITLPRESKDVLYMSELAIKTDWIDPVDGVSLTNAKLISLFNASKRVLSKHATMPVEGINAVTGGSSVYSDIKCTPAAKRFWDAGGKLMQEGVNNVFFNPIDER